MESEVKERCVIIGASPVCDTDMIKKSVCESDFVVCADGGYKYAFAANVKPDLIIGDFDSAEFPENVKCDIVKLPVHKDDTDTMYCVRECMKMGYKEIGIVPTVFNGIPGVNLVLLEKNLRYQG